MKITKRIAQPSIGKGGKYKSLFVKIVRSFSSSTAEGMENGSREQLKPRDNSTSKTITDYEGYALEVIASGGFHYNEPYNYFDGYEMDGNEYKYKTASELADTSKNMDSALLIGALKIILNDPDWDMTKVGRAAQILHHCEMLRLSIREANIENVAHHAMLLQQEIDYLGFMPHQLPARMGEKLITNGKNTGSTNKGKENRFTAYVRFLIQKTKREAHLEGEITIDDVVNNLDNNRDYEGIAIDEIEGDKIHYYIGDKPHSITMAKFREKVSMLKKS